MALHTMKTPHSVLAFASDVDRWQALVNRDPAFDGVFFYSVQTTGVYCRTVCPSKLALRKNVRFHATCRDAEKAGFRPCMRCTPNERSLDERHAGIVVKACRMIEQSDESISLEKLAEAVGMSRHHFHRLFKAQTGVTPKAFTTAHRSQRIKHEIAQRDTITEAIYRAGFNSNGRFYETSTSVLGMTPKNYRAGGAGTSIRFAIGECWLGTILVAASERGVCSILLGDDPDRLARELQDRFPKADMIGGDSSFESWVAIVVGFVANPSIGLELPLDIQGTAFQQRVWQALREIPSGSTASYSEVAERIGHPKSARAVARACAANPLAIAIPCHRVVRTDGTLSGYRWGVEKKRNLLRLERDVEE